MPPSYDQETGPSTSAADQDIYAPPCTRRKTQQDTYCCSGVGAFQWTSGTRLSKLLQYCMLTASKTNIDSYVVAVMLSSNLHSYKGEGPVNHVLVCLLS